MALHAVETAFYGVCDLTVLAYTIATDIGMRYRQGVENITHKLLPETAAKVISVVLTALPTLWMHFYHTAALAVLFTLHTFTQVRTYITDADLSLAFGLEFVIEASRFIAKNLHTQLLTGHKHVAVTMVCALLGAFYLHQARFQSSV